MTPLSYPSQYLRSGSVPRFGVGIHRTATPRIVLVVLSVALLALGPGVACRSEPLIRKIEPGERVQPAGRVAPAAPVEPVGSVELPEERVPVRNEPPAPASPEDLLQERYFARWDCLLIGDWSGAYEVRSSFRT